MICSTLILCLLSYLLHGHVGPLHRPEQPSQSVLLFPAAVDRNHRSSICCPVNVEGVGAFAADLALTWWVMLRGGDVEQALKVDSSFIGPENCRCITTIVRFDLWFNCDLTILVLNGQDWCRISCHVRLIISGHLLALFSCNCSTILDNLIVWEAYFFIIDRSTSYWTACVWRLCYHELWKSFLNLKHLFNIIDDLTSVDHEFLSINYTLAL